MGQQASAPGLRGTREIWSEGKVGEKGEDGRKNQKMTLTDLGKWVRSVTHTKEHESLHIQGGLLAPLGALAGLDL